MAPTPQTPKDKKVPWSKAFQLFKDYFINSDERLVAWLYLIGTVFCVVGMVALFAAMSWWSAAFWTVLAAKEIVPFLLCMGQIALIISGLVTVFTLKNYLIGKLAIQWRNWLTHKMLHSLFHGENNYLDLKRCPDEIDNVAQRVQEDIKTFVELTLHLGADLIKSVLSLATFIGTLWIIGGPLSVTLLGLHIVIPGYLVWVALLTSVLASLSTHYIGKSLKENTKASERMEADLREDLMELSDEAENIAEEHAEKYYKTSLENKIQDINTNNYRKLDTLTRVTAFQNFYMNISGILPDILATPLYFSGLIELGQLAQIGMSFNQVSSSFSWFVESYENLAYYQTSLERIIELEHALGKDGMVTNDKMIVRKVRDKEWITIKRLNIMEPETSSTPYIMRNLNIKLKPHEHIVIKGASGLGKSTLFKAISGTWKYGDGKIAIPSGKSFYFLPQKPAIPRDTFMAVLAYPDSVDTYTEEEYITAMRAVGRMDKFITKLHEKRSWSKELSGGEQQRISFIRVLLKKPNWVFLDEATSSLDEESENHVYKLVKQLPDTTIVSIAHRSTVEKHHSKILFFNANDNREIKVNCEAASYEQCSA